MRNVKTRMLWVLAVVFVIIGASYAQIAPPLVVNLVDPPDYVKGGNLTVEIDDDLSSYPTDGPTSSHFQFRRVSIDPTSGYDTTTDWMPWSMGTSATFTGADDGVIVGYQVRVADSASTSEWSPVREVMHDIADPYWEDTTLVAQWCSSDEEIRLIWNDAEDAASGVMGYRIYRRPATDRRELYYIDESEVATYYDYVEATYIGSYIWNDTDVTPGYSYAYTVVPVDRVGNFCRSNRVVIITASGPDMCIEPIPHAPLMEIPEYTDDDHIDIRIWTSIAPPYATWRYKYKVIETDTDGDETIFTSAWTSETHYTHYLEECFTYQFFAKCTSLTAGSGVHSSDWSHMAPGSERITTRDMYGPDCAVDSLNAVPEGEGIHVRFYSEDPNSSDCASGFRHFNLYRVSSATLDTISFSELLRNIETMGDSYLLREYYAADAPLFEYWDDGPTDPDIDLEDRGIYHYFVFAVDSLFHFSNPMCVATASDTSKPDKGAITPMLEELPEFTQGECVTITIVDTTRCDNIAINIQASQFRDFSVLDYEMEYPIHDPVFTNPDDGDCSDWDYLTFERCGLTESEICFRVQGIDEVGNISPWSNVVCTRMDNSAPTAVHIDSVVAISDNVAHIRNLIKWRHSSDAVSGLAGYYVYKASTETDPFETLLATIVDPYVHEFVDEEPLDTDFWHNNYYTVIPFDNVGNLDTISRFYTSSFEELTPPRPPVIDTVYMEIVGSYVNVIIEWSDTTSPGHGVPLMNSYRVEHANNEAWFYPYEEIDPYLVGREDEVSGVRRLVMRHSILQGSTSKFFRITAIDPMGNEGGFSETYEYVREMEEETSYVFLNAGWNLFSLPVHPGSYEVDYVLGDTYISVNGYDPTTGSYYTPTEFIPGEGYFVLYPTDEMLELVGISIEKYVLPTGRGFNLVGATFNEDESFGYTEGCIISNSFEYDAFTRMYSGPITELQPSQAYWVMFEEEGYFWAPESEYDFDRALPSDDTEPVINSTLKLNLGDMTLEMVNSYDANATLDRFDRALPPLAPEMTRAGNFVSEDGFALSKDTRNNDIYTLRVNESSLLTWEDNSIALTIDGVTRLSSENIVLEPGVYKVQTSVNKVDNFELVGAYPNPFNGATNISFNVPNDGDVEVEIYNLSGKLIWSRHMDIETAGKYDISWDGRDGSGSQMNSGVYFCRVNFADRQETLRLLYVR